MNNIIDNKEIKFSNSLKHLLLAIKKSDIELNTDLVRHALAKEYCFDLLLGDVIYHLIKLYIEASKEPRFQIPYSHDQGIQFENIIKAPINGFFNLAKYPQMNPRLDTTATVEEFYNCIIKHILSELRLANISWCRNYLGLPE